MTAVRVGSRLDQLRALRQRIDLAIAAAERDELIDPRCRRVPQVTTPAPPQESSPEVPDDQDNQAGVVVPVRWVRVDVIRDWANSHGHHLHPRGRILHEVLDKFAAAHQ